MIGIGCELNSEYRNTGRQISPEVVTIPDGGNAAS
jgi:hypothetical protein